MSFTRPDTLPEWAVQDQVDPVSLQNNVLTPPPQAQQYGWQRLQFPPRNWFNWLARYTYLWLGYLSQQEAQRVSAVGTGSAVTVFNTTLGGMYLLTVIDQAVPANFYQGVAWSAPAPGGAITMSQTSASTLTVSTISTGGAITASGGTGPYSYFAQSIPDA